MLKIAVLFTNYGPYHIARVSALQEHCHQIGWNVVGIELARAEADYAWKANLQNLPFPLISVVNDRQREEVKNHQLLPKLYSILRKIQPDVVVIAGYFESAMIATLVWSLWHGKLPILLSETTETDFTRAWCRETIKRWLLKPYKSALVGGQPQKRYLMKLGVPKEAIFCGYDVVGNDAFHPDKIKSLAPPLNKPYFLAINRFIPKKNLPFLISAYATYRQLAKDRAWDLVLCGDGSMRSQIEQQIKDLGLTKFIHITGFLQQQELLPYFAHAGCFIHASTHEQWGLVVNEAMAAGLPVLVSNRCGCFEDLVVEGINGFGFNPYDREQLTKLMLKVSLGEIDLDKISQAALQHIQKFSPDYFAQGLIKAVEYALAHQN
ncbi:glycosyltransferase family 4 protein [Moorena producens JHB]|uniref:Glycosyltransferase family 4 protein n=1 Tax=Moorena producens (strain JHB) TaxID=1454205 RepID=A0A1D9G8E0_MOOP1|nr:glycosyltransferase family 4 protein [Moorena producens]AOY83926.1 glycosyltransferase family 4 protein [Moorena producens JHB]